MVVTSGYQFYHGHHQKFIALLILCFLDCGQGDGKEKREIFTTKSKGGQPGGPGNAEWQQLWYSSVAEFQKLTEPLLDNTTETNLTVPFGSTAYMHCRVRNLGERTISWVRRRDWHILTSGLFTYTNDERFTVLHAEGSDDWTLQIKYVQKRDNGTYECQISTGTGIMSSFINLHIVVPEVHIDGPSELHVDMGSIINLLCIIEKSPQPPQYVFWYHNEKMINYDNNRGGIVVNTENGGRSTSRLTIHDVIDTDSGNYTCKAANAEPAYVYVFVSEGDTMAAISRRKSTASGIEVMLWFVALPLMVISIR
ncbi:Hypothetical protein CINCED_3A010949 [Cinara cedri]|nr:Hypothetical protein CINCED_3A010949 [Cinara cedri]